MHTNVGHEAITEAVHILLAGGLVAFPTETVYGLGADATNESAVRRIFEVKGRPSNNPLILHFASLDAIYPYIDLSKSPDPSRLSLHLHRLSTMWPGPLSLVLPRGNGIADSVCAGGDTIAVRVPNHPVALSLLKAFGRPIAAPSANPSSYISPTTAHHVRASLGDKVQLILDGGTCSVGVESTVLSLSHQPPRLLRPGAVTRDAIEACIESAIERSSESGSPGQGPMLSPGLLAKHYSPRTKVVLRTTQTYAQLPAGRIGAIRFSSDPIDFPVAEQRYLSRTGQLEEIAAHLFGALRELDTLGLEAIVVDTCEPVGLGEAIMDRLIRASSE